jgi:FKBP-type peptidyl-prolyl cis-trans isomerase
MIPGWEDGLQVMNKDSRVQFIIPSELAYGSEGVGAKIPPYQTLIFVIKLFDIKPS